MKNIDWIQEWCDSLRLQSFSKIKAQFEFSVHYERNFGPRWNRAGLTVQVIPSDQFELLIDESMTNQSTRLKCPDQVIYGILDILLTSDPMPVLGLKLVLISCEIDPVETTDDSLRQVGRLAGKKIVKDGFESFP